MTGYEDVWSTHVKFSFFILGHKSSIEIKFKTFDSF